jgi:Protein of unknown function (DUF429)
MGVMHELTWGLDVSTDKAKTAAVALDWSTPGEARVVDVRRPLHAADIAPLISKHRESRWAVDVPFGWPDLFVALMADRHDGLLPAEAMPAAADWEMWRTRQVAQRCTDRFLTDDPRIKTRPLPASFLLLWATAAMWVLVEAQLVSLGVGIDRAGLEGAVCETYPSAALSAWASGRQSRLGMSCSPISPSLPPTSPCFPSSRVTMCATPSYVPLLHGPVTWNSLSARLLTH